MNTTVSVACAVQALVVRLGDPDGSVEEAWHSCYASVIIHPQADLYSEKRHEITETNPRYTWQVANSPALGSIPLPSEDNLEYFSSLKLQFISIKLLNLSFLGPSFFGYLENHHQCWDKLVLIHWLIGIVRSLESFKTKGAIWRSSKIETPFTTPSVGMWFFA